MLTGDDLERTVATNRCWVSNTSDRYSVYARREGMSAADDLADDVNSSATCIGNSESRWECNAQITSGNCGSSVECEGSSHNLRMVVLTQFDRIINP